MPAALRHHLDPRLQGQGGLRDGLRQPGGRQDSSRSCSPRGEIRAVEGLWVTHYHDDHVDAIPEFQKAFDCPCITDRHVAEVITDPLAWRLPCISPSKARVDRATRDGESWQWHEFKLTAYHFPGQTLYHSGPAGRGGEDCGCSSSATRSPWRASTTTARRTATGSGPGVGFDRCIALIEKLRPTHIFNCHVNEAFDFTPEECRFMRANLAEREKLFGELVPWDHANYGMDEPWVRCDPYEQQGKPGGEVAVDVVVTNHSPAANTAACRAILPRRWTRADRVDERRSRAEDGGPARACRRIPPAPIPAATSCRSTFATALGTCRSSPKRSW